MSLANLFETNHEKARQYATEGLMIYPSFKLLFNGTILDFTKSLLRDTIEKSNEAVQKKARQWASYH